MSKKSAFSGFENLRACKTCATVAVRKECRKLCFAKNGVDHSTLVSHPWAQAEQRTSIRIITERLISNANPGYCLFILGSTPFPLGGEFLSCSLENRRPLCQAREIWRSSRLVCREIEKIILERRSSCTRSLRLPGESIQAGIYPHTLNERKAPWWNHWCNPEDHIRSILFFTRAKNPDWKFRLVLMEYFLGVTGKYLYFVNNKWSG
jgi:hypothetical protein